MKFRTDIKHKIVDTDQAIEYYKWISNITTDWSAQVNTCVRWLKANWWNSDCKQWRMKNWFSYKMKHVVEESQNPHIYISNEAFIVAALNLWFQVYTSWERNAFIKYHIKY